jgi:flagellar M-ring protein FliF
MAQAQQTMMNPGAVVAVGANGNGNDELADSNQKPSPKMMTPPLFEGIMGLRPSWDEARTRYGLLETWQRLTLWGIVVGLIVASVTLFMSMPKTGDDKVLFSNLNDKDGAAIVASLQQMQVPYKYSEGGGAILVPAGMVHDTRLKLAGQGLPKGGFVGFELLENQKLGTSQFVEQINYQRGLEGELSRTISAISAVDNARVHLAIPKPSAFVREQLKPSASVMLRLHPGRFLEETQITAITHLVSSSVPQMAPSQVTIVDQDGGLLAPNAQRLGPGGMDAQQLKYVNDMETQYVKRIMTILEPVVGRDNVKAQVAIDIDFNSIERTEEQFKPNSSPNAASIRSQQNLEAQGPVIQQMGIPGALTNQPPAQGTAAVDAPAAGAAPAAGGANAGAQPGAQGQNAGGAGTPGRTDVAAAGRKESTTNYEVDKAIQYVKGARGGVKRVSTAVAVNFKQVPDKDGKLQPAAFSEQEIKQINDLVREAVGFVDTRGDKVSVANIPFTPEKVISTPFYRDAGVMEFAKDMLKYGVIAAVLGFFVFGILKPMITPVPEQLVVDGVTMDEAEDERLKSELAAMSPEARAKRRLELELEREKRRIQDEEERHLREEEKRAEEEARTRADAEKQQEYEDLLEYTRDYVQREPRVVSTIFKEWLKEEQPAA